MLFPALPGLLLIASGYGIAEQLCYLWRKIAAM